MFIDEYGQVHRHQNNHPPPSMRSYTPPPRPTFEPPQRQEQHPVRNLLIGVVVVIGVIWISSSISQKPQQTTASKPTVSAATVPVLNATVRQDLNMRSGPGKDYIVLQKMLRGARVEVVDNSGPWVKIRYNGKEGFSDRSYLSIDNSSTSATTNSNRTVRIQNNTGYLVYHVYIVPNSTRYWGDDKLGNATLRNGTAIALALPDSAVDRYNILLKDSDGDSYRKSDIPIKEGQTIFFTLNDLYRN
jgi:uncharacterized protein YraI